MLAGIHSHSNMYEEKCKRGEHCGHYMEDGEECCDCGAVPPGVDPVTGEEISQESTKMTDSTSTSGVANRGFASMDRNKQREIASKGGKAAHTKGTAHQWTSQEAAVAGRKGGLKVSANRQHMQDIGRKGGASRSAVANAPRSELPHGAD